MKDQKGSALITVIMVVLVLTLVGLAALVYMSVEDQVSNNDRLQKEALYAAETGLRIGERVLGTQIQTYSITALLGQPWAPSATVSNPAVTPNVPVTPDLPSYAGETGLPKYDLAHLGTNVWGPPPWNLLLAAQQWAAIPVTYTSPTNVATSNRAFFSLYLRNNQDDYSGSPTTDQDGKVDMISVGYLVDSGNRILAVKIIAEGFNLGSLPQFGAQKGLAANNPWSWY